MLQALYTYLYTGSILFLCYVFFYVLRVKVRGEGVDQYQVEMENFIKQMVRTAGIEVQNIEGMVNILALALAILYSNCIKYIFFLLLYFISLKKILISFPLFISLIFSQCRGRAGAAPLPHAEARPHPRLEHGAGLGQPPAHQDRAPQF